MKKIYLTNAFSLGMIPGHCRFQVETVMATEVPADAVSAIGHESTAQVLSGLLGRKVEMSRTAIHVGIGDELFVATILAPDGRPYRLPEGKVFTAAELGELRLEFRKVTIE